MNTKIMLIPCLILMSCSDSKKLEERVNSENVLNQRKEGRGEMKNVDGEVLKTIGGVNYVKSGNINISDKIVHKCLVESQKKIKDLNMSKDIVPQISEMNNGTIEVRYVDFPKNQKDPGEGAYNVSVELTKEGEVIRAFVRH